MTPRERFYMVTSHPPKWPDRICNEFIGWGSAGPLDEEPYGLKAIAEYVGVPDFADPCPAPPLGYTRVDERILEKFNCDFRYIPTITTRSMEELPNGYYRAANGVLWKHAYGTSRPYGARLGVPRLHLAPESEQPGAQLRTLKDIDEYPYWPDTESAKARQTIEKNAREAAKIAKKLHEETDFVVVGGSNPYSSEQHRFVRGMKSWSIDLKKNFEFYHAFANRMLQHGMDIAEIVYSAVGDYVDCVNAGPGDMGTQQGPMISLEDFREFCVPYQEKSIGLIKKHTKARIRAHMCGSIHLYMKDLAELGIDLVGQQITPTTFHMEPERLRRDYGNIISFWGGIDAQVVLNRYTPDQIRNWVERVVYSLAPGHVVASNHTIQSDSSPENIWFAHKAIEEFGKMVYGN